MRNLRGSVRYTKMGKKGDVPSISVTFLGADVHFTEKQATELENAVKAGVAGNTGASLTRGARCWNLLVTLKDAPKRWTDQGMIAECRAICRVASVTIQEGPLPSYR